VAFLALYSVSLGSSSIRLIHLPGCILKKRALVGQRRYSKSQGGEEAAAKKASRRAASFMRTNSFYAQAVADCLEFIKRNSLPMEDYGSPVIVAGAGR
jgi:hypothetical protein